MNTFHALVLGVVEGISEFLPISSTGHLILASKLIGLEEGNFLKSFEIVIQLGAILSVVSLYWEKFLRIDVLKRLAVAFLPTGVLGLIFYKTIKTYLLGNASVVVAALFLGGIFLMLFEKTHKEKNTHESIESLPYKKAFLIGLFQSVAMIPGVSRSAATIVGGLVLGMSRTAIVEFSFLLAVPTMAAATGLDLLKNASSFSANEALVLAVGFVSSYIVAIAAIKWLLRYVRTHSFFAFGAYRIVVAVLYALLFLA